MDTHAITLRLANSNDAEDLRSYFRTLSPASRRDRFLAGVADQSLHDILRSIGCFGSASFCVIATRQSGHLREIIGEALCATAPTTEVAVSVADAVQDCGLGRALLAAVETLALQRGAHELTGTILATNDRIRALAASLGYRLERCEGDWTHSVMRKALPVCAILPFRSSAAMAASVRPYLKGALRDAVSGA